MTVALAVASSAVWAALAYCLRLPHPDEYAGRHRRRRHPSHAPRRVRR